MTRHSLVVCLICVAAAAHAQDSSLAERSVLVTASRVPEPLANTLWSSTVLTRADIEARQANSLPELLSGLAGVNIINNGGVGKVSAVLMRGAESDHTLLLIDGVRVASATVGTAPFELIPLEQIERIEVVRGPRSTLYGTDAIGGVIQIFTRRESHAGLTYGARAGGGSHDTRKVSVDLRAQGERAWIDVGADSIDTDGFNSCASAAGAAFAACFVDEPDADSHRNTSGSLAAGYALTDSWNIQLHSLFADGRTEYDGSVFAGNETDFAQRVFALSLDGALSRRWHARAMLGLNEDHQDTFFHDEVGTVPTGTFDTDRDTASVQVDGALNEALRLIAGVERQRDSIESDTEYAVESRDTMGVFSELHAQIGAWSALAGARYEDNEQFGDHITGNAGLGRALTDRLRVTATWGTAFHAPAFNDLYFPFFGNPELEPEESRSFEVGVNGRAATMPLDWSLHVFQTHIDQLIGFDASFSVVNVNESRIRGVELQADWRAQRWQLGAQATWLDPVNRSDGDRLLPRRAKESASLELQRIWPSLSIGAVLRYQGRRFDDLANTRELGGYVIADIAATQTIGRSFELQARVANVFDRDYATAAFYLQDGRNYSMALRYRFATQR
jgi:vitamin B12 transporter